MIDNKLYLEKGKGEPIILLHGLFGALSNWKTVVNQFAKTHRVIIPKIPLTEVDVKKANLESLTDYVKKFINEFKEDRRPNIVIKLPVIIKFLAIFIVFSIASGSNPKTTGVFSCTIFLDQ